MIRHVAISMSLLFLATMAGAHLGDRLIPIYELTDEEVTRISLTDQSVSEWRAILGPPTLRASEFFADPSVGEGAPYDPNDLDYSIWLGWHRAGNHLYLAMERVDNVYVNEYAGGELGQLWRHDSVEFMVDGDHSGGDEAGGAQQYIAIAESPDGRTVSYLGPGVGEAWVSVPPFADGGGGSEGEVSVLEFYVTPFDDLIETSPDSSRISPLYPGKIIGFQISVPDFDTAPSDYRAFHILSGQAATWKAAERFVDGRLVAAGQRTPTVARSDSWGRIKALSSE